MRSALDALGRPCTQIVSSAAGLPSTVTLADLRGLGTEAQWQSAWLAAWHAYAPSVQRQVRRLAIDADEDDVGDVVAATWAKAVSNIGQCRSVETLGGWLIRIATNEWKNYVRSGVAERRRGQEYSRELTMRAERGPHSDDAVLAAVDLQRAVAQLDDEEVQWLELRLSGFTHEEIVAIMQINGVAASEWLRSRVRRKLEAL